MAKSLNVYIQYLSLLNVKILIMSWILLIFTSSNTSGMKQKLVFCTFMYYISKCLNKLFHLFSNFYNFSLLIFWYLNISCRLFLFSCCYFHVYLQFCGPITVKKVYLCREEREAILYLSFRLQLQLYDKTGERSFLFPLIGPPRNHNCICEFPFSIISS